MQHEKVTAPYLSEKFEVSRRTINRDIEDLSKAGIPIITLQGTGGGITVADGFKIDKTLFTPQEMQTIIAGLKSLDSISEDNNYKNLIDKFTIQEERITCPQNHLIINLSSHYKQTLAPKIKTIQQALHFHQIITFDYYYEKGMKVKTIEPYYILFQWSAWYVYGYCLSKNDYRMYKLNRINNLDIDKHYYVPREMNNTSPIICDYFTDKYKIKAIFDECVKYRLVDEYGLDSFTYLENNKLLFQTTFTNKNYLIEWLLSFGEKVILLEPEDIRNELIEKIKLLSTLYF